jgi:hypothetical protein
MNLEQPNTAPACEETLIKEPLPSYKETAADIRVLKIHTALHLQTKGKDLLKEDNCWPKALAEVMVNKKNFTAGEHREGLKVLSSYIHFCPTEAEEIIQSKRISGMNAVLGFG